MRQFLFLLLLCLFAPGATADEGGPKNPAMVVHLLDYLARDYGGAVQGGKVISPFEYEEQLQFVAIVRERALQEGPYQADKTFVEAVEGFAQLIKDKAAEDLVVQRARELQVQAIKLAKLPMSPRHWPQLNRGAGVYAQHCGSCHGSQGFGDGEAGKGLDPAPANFHDPDTMAVSSPYQYYNTIRLGVPGTGMAAYTQLTDEQVWDVAFYVKHLGHRAAKAAKGNLPLNLDAVASMSDEQILAALKKGSVEEKTAVLAQLRSHQPNLGIDHFIAVTTSKMNDSLETYRGGQSEMALKLSLQAYLEGVEPLEPKIEAKDPALLEAIEEQMTGYRSLLKEQAAMVQVEQKYAEIQKTIERIQASFLQAKMSPAAAFGASFSIFLREGFEAVLIIIVLLSVLKAMNASHAAKWVHAGWILACTVGVIAWFASGLLMEMSGFSRELMEGLISLFAVGVLLYVGFWLHGHSQIEKWKSFLKKQVQEAMDAKKLTGLLVISFIAVFREAFEVVLFLRAIWLDLDGGGQTSASLGILTSLVAIFGLSYFMTRTSRKLPIGLLFRACSVIMLVLAVILVGKGVHSIQETGLIPESALGLQLKVSLIGLYPTWQTIGAQLTAIAMILWLRKKQFEKPESNAEWVKSH